MENGVFNFLSQKDNYYLGNDADIQIMDVGEFLEDDLTLYQIEETVSIEKEVKKVAVENILTSMNIDGINFLYLVINNNGKTHFYFGIVRDLYYDKESMFEIDEIGKYILNPSICGNLIGSKISKLDSNEKKEIHKILDEVDYFSVLEGAPGINSEGDKYIDTLVNVMNGEEKFGILMILSPFNVSEILDIESSLSKLYSKISALAQSNTQEAVSKSTNNSLADTVGESFTNVKSASLSVRGSLNETKGGSIGTEISTTSGISETGGQTTQQNNNQQGTRQNSNLNDNQQNTKQNNSQQYTRARHSNRNNSVSKNTTITNNNHESSNLGDNWSSTSGKESNVLGLLSRSNTTNSSLTQVNGSNDGKTTTISSQAINKEVQQWIEYMDEVLFPRLDYGKGKGMFNVSTFLFAGEKAILKSLENIARLFFAGKSGNKVPIRAIGIKKDNKKIDIYKKFQLPHGNFPENKGINNPLARSAISQYLTEDGDLILGNWISTNELSSIIAFPKKEN